MCNVSKHGCNDHGLTSSQESEFLGRQTASAEEGCARGVLTQQRFSAPRRYREISEWTQISAAAAAAEPWSFVSRELFRFVCFTCLLKTLQKRAFYTKYHIMKGVKNNEYHKQ